MARYRLHKISHDDTLPHIAQFYMGNYSNWEVIVEYNNLEYPYIVSTSEEKLQNPEGLVTIGDTLTIPIEQNVRDYDTDTLNGQDREEILGLALGKDLDMITNPSEYERYGGNTEILALGSDGRGDVKTLTGVENLKQTLIKRLLTPKGSLILHPNYGSNLAKLLGSRTIYGLLEIISNEVLQTIKEDKRVESARLLNSTLDGGSYIGEFEVNLHSFDDYFKLVVNGDGSAIVVL